MIQVLLSEFTRETQQVVGLEKALHWGAAILALLVILATVYFAHYWSKKDDD